MVSVTKIIAISKPSSAKKQMSGAKGDRKNLAGDRRFSFCGSGDVFGVW
jgi:hypothetical protein